MNKRTSSPVFSGGTSLVSSQGIGFGPARGDPLQLTFTRRVGVPYEHGLARLHEAWDHAASSGDFEIGRSRLVGPMPAPTDEDRTEFDAALWRGPLRRPASMRLDVTRWSDAFGTWLELQPLLDVRPDDRYFREGNRLLDWVVAVLT